MDRFLPAGYELLTEIAQTEALARGNSVRQRHRLTRTFGKGNWRKMKGTGLVRFPTGRFAGRKFTGLANMKSKSKRRSEKVNRPTPAKNHHFVICIRGTGFDLIRAKAYGLIDDREATRLGCVRVIDESGDDYLYPASWFVRIRPEKDSERRLAVALRAV